MTYDDDCAIERGEALDMAADEFDELERKCEAETRRAIAAETELRETASALAQTRARLAEAVASKDEAYTERNHVVALLARIYPSGHRKTHIPGWDSAWNGCVFIDTPEGQLSWHYHDRESHMFEGLPAYTRPWDGHTTPEKYLRVDRLVTRLSPAPPPSPEPVLTDACGPGPCPKKSCDDPQCYNYDSPPAQDAKPPSIQFKVRADLVERERLGIERYGTALYPHNGRTSLQDLYEELLDAACYARQALEERAPERVLTPAQHAGIGAGGGDEDERDAEPTQLERIEAALELAEGRFRLRDHGGVIQGEFYDRVKDILRSARGAR